MQRRPKTGVGPTDIRAAAQQLRSGKLTQAEVNRIADLFEGVAEVIEGLDNRLQDLESYLRQQKSRG